jgi:phosphate-selective porin OprO and OprP
LQILFIQLWKKADMRISLLKFSLLLFLGCFFFVQGQEAEDHVPLEKEGLSDKPKEKQGKESNEQADKPKEKDHIPLEKEELSEAHSEDDKESSVTSFYEEGFWWKGKEQTLHLGGYVQVDGRFFLNSNAGHSTFLIRRARLFATGVIQDLFGYMLMGRWDRQEAALHAAWIDTQKPKCTRIRLGLFTQPFGLDSTYSSLYWDFNERSLGSVNFIHQEDIGVMLFGEMADERIEYGVGFFNGRARRLDNNHDKELVGRLVVAPFLKHCHLFKKLYFGFSGSNGRHTEDLTDEGFRTPVDSLFWRWEGSSDDPITVDDQKIRWGADFEWLYGSLSCRGEYTYADWGEIEFHSMQQRFKGHSWYIESGYILTGEEKPRDAPVIPHRPLDFKCGFGAWEVVGRYQFFHAPAAFLERGFASGANQVQGVTVGLNGYLTSMVTTRIDWDYLTFNHRVFLTSRPVKHMSVIIARLQALF